MHWKCNACNKPFTRPQPHRCGSIFRKHFRKKDRLWQLMVSAADIVAEFLTQNGLEYTNRVDMAMHVYRVMPHRLNIIVKNTGEIYVTGYNFKLIFIAIDDIPETCIKTSIFEPNWGEIIIASCLKDIEKSNGTSI